MLDFYKLLLPIMISSLQVRLVEKLIEEGVIHSPKVIQTLSAIDRGCFLPSLSSAYDDSPKSIGFNATISAPHMHGYALEYLKDYLIPGTSALDIGSGSGYLTLCMAEMMNYQGKIIGIEHITELVERSNKSIEMCKPGNINRRVIEIIEGDGRNGYPRYAPYKAIHVGAAAETIPQALIEQLDFGGRLVIPVGKKSETQKIVLVDKDLNGNISMKNELRVVYVPLTDKNLQC